MKRIDLTGRRFGSLIVVRHVPSAETNDGRAGWLVRCDCGREKTVNADALRRGKITSCRCGRTRNERVKATNMADATHQDVTGQTFGELTAVSYIRRDFWLWKCSCGKETEARLSLVKDGEIRSCGHILSETARKKAVEDNVFEHYDGTTVTRLRHIMANPETKGIKVRRLANGGCSYQARLMLRGKRINLGTFATREEAEKARREGERRYFLPIIEAFEESDS